MDNSYYVHSSSASIGGRFNLFSENDKRARKLEAESYCKNDYLYRQHIIIASQAIQLERMLHPSGWYSKKSQSLSSSGSLMG